MKDEEAEGKASTKNEEAEGKATMKEEKAEGKVVAKKSTNKKVKKGPSTSKMERWNVRLEECKAYREKFGHCKIPTNYKDNKSLGIWVQETRRNFKLAKQGKKARSPLKDDQIEQLDDIGFHWSWTPDPNLTAESDTSWEVNFAKLQEYKESHDNFDVPMDGGLSSLATWAKVQRNQNNLRDTKRKTFITKKRIDKLNEIAFNWDGDRKF